MAQHQPAPKPGIDTFDLSDSHAFDQATIAAMAKAYEIGCLTIKGRPDSDKDRLARLIIEIAKDGERDPVQLCAKAVNRITSPN